MFKNSFGLPPSGPSEYPGSLVYQPSNKQETEEMKIERFERVIDQLKKMVDKVKQQNKGCRMQFEREIAYKTELEHHLKKVVDKVIKERKKTMDEQNKQRKQSAKFYITALDSTPNLSNTGQDDHECTQEERERVIELLLGQDKVIKLLYDQPEPKMTQNGDFPPISEEHKLAGQNYPQMQM